MLRSTTAAMIPVHAGRRRRKGGGCVGVKRRHVISERASSQIFAKRACLFASQATIHRTVYHTNDVTLVDAHRMVNKRSFRGRGLIPTEATPESTPPPPSSTAAAAAAAATRQGPSTVQAVQVHNGFLGLPVRLPTSGTTVWRSKKQRQQQTVDEEPVKQWIYMRKKEEEEVEVARTQADDPSPSSNPAADIAKPSTAGATVFAVNLPFGSTVSSVKRGLQDLIDARRSSSSSSTTTTTTARILGSRSSSSSKSSRSLIPKDKGGKGKGRARELDFQSLVDEDGDDGRELSTSSSSITTPDVLDVEFVHPAHSRKRPDGTSLLEAEGIYHPSILLAKSSSHDSVQDDAGTNGQPVSKRAKKAKRARLAKAAAADADAAGPVQPSIHPLLLSDTLDLQQALAHLHPGTSTVKAHITLASTSALATLLAPSPSSTWSLTTWPESSYPADSPPDGVTGGVNQQTSDRTSTTRDEMLFDLSRPSLSHLKLHADEWMKAFDARHPRPSSAPGAGRGQEEEEVPTKSKRAKAREAAAKKAKREELQKEKAIKKRRVYDDDFESAEADPDGWTTVTRGGRYGRSAADEEDEEMMGIVDREDMRRAELEGFASGRRSVGVASRDFIRAEDARVKAERRRELLALNNKLGITAPAGSDENAAPGLILPPSSTPDTGTFDDELGQLVQEEGQQETSRGSGRGQKKKKSRGIEVGMYGHQKREENKKRESSWFPVAWIESPTVPFLPKGCVPCGPGDAPALKTG